MKNIALFLVIGIPFLCIMSCHQSKNEERVETIFDAIELTFRSIPKAFQKGLYDVCNAEEGSTLESLYEKFNKEKCECSFTEIEAYEGVSKDCYESYCYARGLRLGYGYRSVIKEFEYDPEIKKIVKQKKLWVGGYSLAEFLSYINIEEQFYLYYLYKIEEGYKPIYSNPKKVIPEFPVFFALNENDSRIFKIQKEDLDKLTPYISKLKWDMSLEEVNSTLKDIIIYSERVKDYPVLNRFNICYLLVGDYQLEVKFHYSPRVRAVHIGEVMPLKR